MRKFIFILGVVLAGGFIVGLAIAGSGTQDDPLGPGDHIPVCHATGSATNPYVYIEPSASSGGPAGHGGHEGDIFAGYWFQQNRNADAVFVSGRNEHLLALLDTECVQAGTTTTETPPTTTEIPPVTTTLPTGLECPPGTESKGDVCVPPNQPTHGPLAPPELFDEGIERGCPEGFVFSEGRCAVAGLW